MRITSILAMLLVSNILFVACWTADFRMHDAEQRCEYAEAYFIAENEYNDGSDTKYLEQMKKYSSLEIDKNIRAMEFALISGKFSNLAEDMFSINSQTDLMISNADLHGVIVNKADIYISLKDSMAKAIDMTYLQMQQAFKLHDYETTYNIALEIRNFKNVDNYLSSSKAELDYKEAEILFQQGRYRAAYDAFTLLVPNFKNSTGYMEKCIEYGNSTILITCRDALFKSIVLDKFLNHFRNDPFWTFTDEQTVKASHSESVNVSKYVIRVDFFNEKYLFRASYTLVEGATGNILDTYSCSETLNPARYEYLATKSQTETHVKTESRADSKDVKSNEDNKQDKVDSDKQKTSSKTTVISNEYEKEFDTKRYLIDKNEVMEILGKRVLQDLNGKLASLEYK